MIQKKIHYCWFGRGVLPDLAQKCIASWKQFLPEYEIIEWNEDRFDIQSNRYVREAYENRKFAFVSDYVRLYALYHQGGVYMDTDVEVLKPLDQFLSDEAFSGFESPQHVATSIIGSKKRQPFIGELLSEYANRCFVKPDGTFDMSTNVEAVTASAISHNLKLDGNMQTVAGMSFYPVEFFCPYDDATGKLNLTENSCCIHWFSKSWIDPRVRFRSKCTKVFHRYFGKDCFVWLKNILGEIK